MLIWKRLGKILKVVFLVVTNQCGKMFGICVNFSLIRYECFSPIHQRPISSSEELPIQFRYHSHIDDCLLRLAVRQVIQEMLVGCSGLGFEKDADLEIWIKAVSAWTFGVTLVCAEWNTMSDYPPTFYVPGSGRMNGGTSLGWALHPAQPNLSWLGWYGHWLICIC